MNIIKKAASLFGFNQEDSSAELRRRKTQWDILASKGKAIIFLVAIIAEIGFFYYMALKYGLIDDKKVEDKKIAVIDFNKEVTQKYVSTIEEKLDEVREEDEYRELLFIMNSPGGSPSASEELSEYLKDFAKEKHVTMYVQSVAASGGYYIASAVKPLIANKNAIVGSIGVIMPHYNIGKMAENLGIEEDDISAGEFKKPISFFKKISDKDRAYLKKQMLTPIYKNFIASVAKNRGVSADVLLPYTEGRIYIANDKNILGVLVDEISVLHRIKREIKKKYTDKVSFVNLMKHPRNKLFDESVKFDLNLNLGEESSVVNALK